MLVKVHDREPALLGSVEAGELLGCRVPDVNKGEVRQEHAQEWEARRYVVVETTAEDFVVLGRLDNGLEVLQHLPSLRGDDVQVRRRRVMVELFSCR